PDREAQTDVFVEPRVFALDPHAMQQVVLRLLHDRLVQVMTLGDLPCGADLVGRPLRGAPVERLAARHEVAHRPDRFLDRRFGIGAMAEQQVDEVEAESFERAVDRVRQILAVQRVLHVGLVVQAPEHLRGDDVAVARPTQLRDRLAHDALRLAAGVRLGIVEEVHARLLCGVETFHGGVDAELVAERHPRSEGQHTDLEAAAAETSIFHDGDRTLAAVLLTVVVQTSETVSATRSRKAKIEALATLLSACAPDEVATVVCLLTGEPRQGRIGVGWSTLSAVRSRVGGAPGGPPVTVAELDDALDRIAATTGAGSAAARQAILGDLFARSTPAEADFVVRLL